MSEIAVSEDTFADRDGEVEEAEFEVRGAIMRWPQLKPYYRDGADGPKFQPFGLDYHTLHVDVSFYEPTSDSGRPPYEGNVTSSHITFETEDGERFDANVQEFVPWPTKRDATGWVLLYDEGNSEAFYEGADAFVFPEKDLAKILEWVEEAGY